MDRPESYSSAAKQNLASKMNSFTTDFITDIEITFLLVLEL